MRAFSQSQALIAESVLLDSRLALFHEQEKWLAIADLHFGFELSQRVAGRLVPFWGMESIQTRLSQLLRDYHPATLILLGDLVHDKNGAREFFSLVTRLREQCDVVLLAGNHDTQIKRLTADLRDSFTTDRFEFHHGDCEREQNGRIQIIGHFHPAAIAVMEFEPIRSEGIGSNSITAIANESKMGASRSSGILLSFAIAV